MDLTNFTRCAKCSTRTHAVMVHRNDLRAHREEHTLNDTPCCDAAPHSPEHPHRFNAVARGVRH